MSAEKEAYYKAVQLLNLLTWTEAIVNVATYIYNFLEMTSKNVFRKGQKITAWVRIKIQIHMILSSEGHNEPRFIKHNQMVRKYHCDGYKIDWMKETNILIVKLLILVLIALRCLTNSEISYNLWST